MRRAWATGWCCAASSGTCAALSIPEGRIFDDGPDGFLEIAGPGSRVPRRVNAAWFCVATVDTSGEVQVLQRGQRVIVDRRAVQTTLDDIAVVAIRRLCRPVVSWASIARHSERLDQLRPDRIGIVEVVRCSFSEDCQRRKSRGLPETPDHCCK
ncbi:hypothetical protein IWZ01DRAFT_500920 [Phyllosticta capitalensis]